MKAAWVVFAVPLITLHYPFFFVHEEQAADFVVPPLGSSALIRLRPL